MSGDIPDMPGMTPAATVEQILSGHPVGAGGKTLCQHCGTALREGADVIVYAYRTADADSWDAPSLYCTECSSLADPSGTLGCEEVAASGRVAVTSDCATQSAQLTLLGVEVKHTSPPTEGGAP